MCFSKKNTVNLKKHSTKHQTKGQWLCFSADDVCEYSLKPSKKKEKKKVEKWLFTATRMNTDARRKVRKGVLRVLRMSA